MHQKLPSWSFSFLCALCVFVVNSSFARAQQKDPSPTPGDVMIDKYLAQETDKLSQRFLDGAANQAKAAVERFIASQELQDDLTLLLLRRVSRTYTTKTQST